MAYGLAPSVEWFARVSTVGSRVPGSRYIASPRSDPGWCGEQRKKECFVRRVNTERLVRDLDYLAADVEQLVEASASNAKEAMHDARERIAARLQTAREMLAAAPQCAANEVARFVESTSNRVRANVWTTMGLAAGVSFLMGVLLSHKVTSAPRRHGPSTTGPRP